MASWPGSSCSVTTAPQNTSSGFMFLNHKWYCLEMDRSGLPSILYLFLSSFRFSVLIANGIRDSLLPLSFLKGKLYLFPFGHFGRVLLRGSGEEHPYCIPYYLRFGICTPIQDGTITPSSNSISLKSLEVSNKKKFIFFWPVIGIFCFYFSCHFTFC